MSSSTPHTMYSWRVTALTNWINTRQGGGRLSAGEFQQAGHLDQFHYLGLECNDDIIRLLQLRPGQAVLDVGAGIGGPARYIAWKAGCSILGLDIQDSLVVAASRISAQLDMQDQLQFRTCDASSDQFNEEKKEG